MVAIAMTTVSTAIAMNAARHPNRSPMSVDSGSPSAVPSMSPCRARLVALPLISGALICAVADMATPKNAPEAAPVMSRPASIVP